jgi:hypothetical protein
MRPFGYERATWPSTIWLMPKIASPTVETSDDCGYANRRSWATHSTGHEVISAPMCVAGRQPQIQRPAGMANVIVIRKIAVSASAMSRSIWPTASATIRIGPATAKAHQPLVRSPRAQTLTPTAPRTRGP